MRSAAKLLLTTMFLCAAVAAVAADLAGKATTEDGRKVQLYKDGTWKYATGETKATPSGIPSGSTEKVVDPKGLATVWFDPNKWTKQSDSQQLSQSASISMVHKSREAYAMVIAERIPVPLATLKSFALENAKKAAPDVKIVLEENKKINGADVLVMDMAGTLRGIPFRYHGLYWSSDKGAVQVVTYTSQNIFEEYKSDLDNLLYGVVFKK